MEKGGFDALPSAVSAFPPKGGNENAKRGQKGALFCQKCPLVQKQHAMLFLDFIP